MVKVVAAVWGTELIKFFAALAIFQTDELKKRMNIITATWRNGCFGKIDDHPGHTIPNRHLNKMDVFPKLLFKSSLLMLMRHSNTSPNQQRRRFAFSSVFILLLRNTYWPGAQPAWVPFAVARIHRGVHVRVQTLQNNHEKIIWNDWHKNIYIN